MSGKNTNRQFGLDFGSEDFRSQEALAMDAKDFKSLVTDTEKFAPEQFYPNGAPRPGTPAYFALAVARQEEDKISEGGLHNRGK